MGRNLSKFLLYKLVKMKVVTPIVELLFPVQQFVVLVQQNLTDRGLRVPTFTPVVE